MKSYIISSSDVKYETNISMEDTPLEIVKNFCEENPDDAQYIFSNEKAHQQLLRDGELDEAVSVFELRDVEGHPVRAEWGEPKSHHIRNLRNVDFTLSYQSGSLIAKSDPN